MRLRKRNPQIPRVYPLDELDGFYVDEDLSRCVHVTFDAEDVVVLDIFDTAQAAYTPVGDALSSVEINLQTGEVKFY